MDLIAKITTALFLAITIIIISSIVIISILTIEFKMIISRRKNIQQNLSVEERRLLELSTLISSSMASVNAYILELARKREELQNKKCNCTPISTNSTKN